MTEESFGDSAVEKYVCSQCTGRTGREHVFFTDVNVVPRYCPYCGTSEDHHIETIEEYLRSRNELFEEKIERLENQ